MKPQIVELSYTYKKSDDLVWVLNTKDIPIDKTKIHDEQFVYFAPDSKGGNHKHPRTEWFVGLGRELYFYWLDESGNLQKVAMNPDERIFLITVPPFLPHAVVNHSKKKTAILLEFADGLLEEVEEVTVV